MGTVEMVYLEGFKYPVKASLVYRIIRKRDEGMSVQEVAKQCFVSKDKVCAVIGLTENKRFEIVEQGAKAVPGSPCPYSGDEIEIGRRCAWLAGHYDAHGFEAWAAARFLKAHELALWEADQAPAPSRADIKQR